MTSKYVGVNDVFEIAEIRGKVKAREIIAAANKLATDRGYFIPHQYKAPRDLVLEILGQKVQMNKENHNDRKKTSVKG